MAHLWSVGHADYGEKSAQATDRVQQRETELWTGGVEEAASALETLGQDTESYPDGVRQAPQYLASRTAAMRYADFRARGYLIGSGTVKSAAGNVVQSRMRRPRRGRQRDNADAIPAVLGAFHSGRIRWARQQAAHA